VIDFKWITHSLGPLSFSLLAGFELEWMHDEVEGNLGKELDFMCEARHSERTAANFADYR
jgi:predicted unusual protein kinase regulating ubiquinone biosynthesis (AarF/ABC1/UbiB family)